MSVPVVLQVNICLDPNRSDLPDADQMQCDGGGDCDELQQLSQQMSTHLQITDTGDQSHDSLQSMITALS